MKIDHRSSPSRLCPTAPRGRRNEEEMKWSADSKKNIQCMEEGSIEEMGFCRIAEEGGVEGDANCRKNTKNASKKRAKINEIKTSSATKTICWQDKTWDSRRLSNIPLTLVLVSPLRTRLAWLPPVLLVSTRLHRHEKNLKHLSQRILRRLHSA